MIMVPTVTKDEGLHSPKAIAFIVIKSNRKQFLDKKKYSTIRIFLKKVAKLLKETNNKENRLNVPSTKNLGDMKWTN